MTPISFYFTLHARTTELVERLNRTIFESTNITTLLYSMFEVYTSLTFCNVINLIFKEDLNRRTLPYYGVDIEIIQIHLLLQYK